MAVRNKDKSDDKDVEETPPEPEDRTPEELRQWGISGEPATWAPQHWQTVVTMTRLANRGFAKPASVQEVLDVAFGEGTYQAKDIILAHEPKGTFRHKLKDNVLTLDADGDKDLPLGDGHFEWSFGDSNWPERGRHVRHRFTEPGDYTVTLSVAVAGAQYSVSKDITIEKMSDAEEEGDD